MKKAEERVYNPATRLRASLITAFTHVMGEAWFFRWLIWVNIKKAFVATYRHSFLGVIWAFIIPIIPMTIYVFLGYIRVLRYRGGMPFQVYIMTGMTIWLIFAEGLAATVRSLIAEKNIVTRMRVPLIVVVFSRLGVVCSNTTIRLVFLLLVFWKFNIAFHVSLLLLPFVVLPIVLLSLGLGMLLSYINTVIRDTEQAVSVLLRYGVFFSCVIFPMPTKGWLGATSSLNVVSPFVVAIREFLVYGHMQHISGYVIASGFSVLVFILAVKIFYSLEHMVIERL